MEHEPEFNENDAVDQVAHVSHIVLPIVAAVLMFMLICIAIFMA